MNLRAAWADVPSDDKKHVQAMIPSTIHKDLFYDSLPGYGTAACLVSHLLESFYQRFTSRRTPSMSPSDLEALAQQILTELRLAPELPQFNHEN